MSPPKKAKDRKVGPIRGCSVNKIVAEIRDVGTWEDAAVGA
jgi:hypothetical protein